MLSSVVHVVVVVLNQTLFYLNIKCLEKMTPPKAM
jgi:hypothetical protein